MHADGELIDPYTLKEYKLGKYYNKGKDALKKEFFRHFGHFTDKDFKVFVKHLLGETLNRRVSYPKLSVRRAKALVVDNMSSADWVDRRKRKKVVLQDLMDIKPALRLINKSGDVDEDAWHGWKERHRFSVGTWDFLLSHPKADYFASRLKPDAWTKRAKDLAEKFPEVLHMFNRFMKMKYQLPELSGGIMVRGIDAVAKALVTSTSYHYSARHVNLAVIDARNIPRLKPSDDKSAIEPFLEFLADKLEPKMTKPSVWLLILNDMEDSKAAAKFSNSYMKEYEQFNSKYIPSKAERLNVMNRSADKAPDVPLFFLFKRGDAFAVSVKPCAKSQYIVPRGALYYSDFKWNTEAKWRVNQNELRMEFYLDRLRDFATSGENVLGVYTGSKFLLSSKVSVSKCPMLSSSRR